MGEQEPKRAKKHICVGLLAHVDAGKTTLSEAMLYTTGQLRQLGRVDHRDAFLDGFALERERGITIFSKQAVLPLGERTATLLDTPGHVDFSSEMERTLQVLDCAVLVISGTDGVQSHTVTLWRLLERCRIPTFLFVNKMDLAGTDRRALLAQLQEKLDGGCVDFTQPEAAVWEEAALTDESALAELLERGSLSQDTLRSLVARRRVFPCWFGSALKLEGVEALLDGLTAYAPAPDYPAKLAARVYKISRDGQGTRLTHMKITGGVLRVKILLSGGEGEDAWQEKVDQIRIYSGDKFRTVEEAAAGMVCAVTGLAHTRSGQGLGGEQGEWEPVLEPVLSYQLLLPEGVPPHVALEKLRRLEEEDPQLHILWDSRLQEIRIQLMGQVQQEVLQRVIADRFGMDVAFGPGSVVYRETIARTVEGVGHYEPLRHYAEVHLLLEPLPRGSGLHFASVCSEDQLDRSWQRLILTHLMEKTHLGVLTGSPITDMRLTLASGRAHVKHTEGGDFRQATYRAVRQGLMSAESVLLEPWYRFRLEVPQENLGRAMNDIQQMGGQFQPPDTRGETAVLTGSVPVAGLGDYWKTLAEYTRGRGRLSCAVEGYRPCAEPGPMVEAAGYDPERDVENSPDSIFCAHGAGFPVKWDQVPAYAHLPSALVPPPAEEEPASDVRRRSPAPYPRSREEERELQAIYERTYGQVDRPRAFQSAPKRPAEAPRKRTVPDRVSEPYYLLVDGYNIIFAWDELRDMARENLDSARLMLLDILCNFQGFEKCVVIAVFDAYRVKGNPGSTQRYRNIHVVYTKEAETADTYIERATYAIARDHRVRVATSDSLEQMIILGHGAVKVSAPAFLEEVQAVEGQISDVIARSNRRGESIHTVKKQAVIRGKTPPERP